MKQDYVCGKPVKVINLDGLRVTTEYGVSVYRQALICWDEDFDSRVLKAVDQLIERGNDVSNSVFQEHEGNLVIISDHFIFLANDNSIEVENDYWTVEREEFPNE